MTDERQTSIHQAQATIDRLYEETRVYIPALVGQMAKTYLPPLVLVFLMGTLGASLLVQWLGPAGNSTAAILNVVILLSGFRLTESRFRGTRLFAAYAVIGRTRRDLKTAVTDDESTATAIEVREQAFIEASESFITAMQAQGAKPIKLE